MSVSAATADVEAFASNDTVRVIYGHRTIDKDIAINIWHVRDAHAYAAREYNPCRRGFLALLKAQEHHSTRKHQRRDWLRERLLVVHHQSFTAL